MIDFQTHFVFPTHAVPPSGLLPNDAESWTLKTKDKAVLHGVHVAPDQPSNTLILGFGGNAWNGQDVALYLHQVFPDDHVVAFHYRGYRPSTGTPSAVSLIEDAPLVYDFAIKQLRPAKVFAVGFSIGSGVAATLAARRDLDGLILVTPFDSLRAVAQSWYPWLPIGTFFKHEIDAAAALKGSKVPVAIISAANDEIVPAERTAALTKKVRKLAVNRGIAGAGHNDIYARSEFQLALRDALAKLGGAA